ncbi:hypothetical protein BV898_19110, partial [Hypsibius exemplaris]
MDLVFDRRVATASADQAGHRPMERWPNLGAAPVTECPRRVGSRIAPPMAAPTVGFEMRAGAPEKTGRAERLPQDLVVDWLEYTEPHSDIPP